MITDDILGSGVVCPVAEITSWLDGAALGVVPITQGEVLESAGGDVLATLEFTLPATDEWMPKDPGHALAPFGQELVVRRGFQLRDGAQVGWENLGRFRIRTTEPEDGWLTVFADSIDVRLSMSRWIVETTTTGTLAAQARQICKGIVPIRIDAPDRAAPNRVWEAQGTRREALLELLDAWGCVLRMIDGQLVILPVPTSTTPAVTIRSGAGGTLVSALPDRVTDPITNVVVASSAPADEVTPVVAAMAVTPSGPRAWDGPYGQVVTFYASPVITTIAQAQLAAETRLFRLQSKGSDVTAEVVTDPRTRLDTVVRVLDGPSVTDAVVRAVEVRHALTRGKEPGRVRGQYISGFSGGPPLTPAPPTSRPRRLSLRPSWSGTWRSSGSWVANTAALIQGTLGGVIVLSGAAWYGKLPSNITSGSVLLACTDTGSASSAAPTMRLLAGTSQPAGAAAIVATTTGPSLTEGATVEWDLPPAWVTHLNAGTAGGVGIGNGSGVPLVSLSASGLGMTLALTVTE